jgi:hypothetical protein
MHNAETVQLVQVNYTAQHRAQYVRSIIVRDNRGGRLSLQALKASELPNGGRYSPHEIARTQRPSYVTQHDVAHSYVTRESRRTQTTHSSAVEHISSFGTTVDTARTHTYNKAQ